jgi:hypothetical protein
MKTIHLTLIALTLCTLFGCKKTEGKNPEETAPSAKHHRAIIYFDGDQKLQIDYEGTGYKQFSSQGNGLIEFKAMHLNHWTEKDIRNEKWVDASFKGTFVISGKETLNVRISLMVDNKVPFNIQTLGITHKGSLHSDDPASHPFSAGNHELIIEGEVTGLYDME